jgi:hypothetical protein
MKFVPLSENLLNYAIEQLKEMTDVEILQWLAKRQNVDAVDPVDPDAPLDKPKTRRRRRAYSDLPISRIIRHLGCPNREEILKSAQDDFHWPVPKNHEEALAVVDQSIIRQGARFRPWPDGRWSHLNWKPPVPPKDAEEKRPN